MTKKKLHILFLNSWYPSRILPQNGDFIQRHAEAVALKHQVTTIHVITDKSISENIITDRLINGVRTLITYLRPVKSNFIKQILFIKAYKKLIKIVGDFDLIHINRIFPTGIIALISNKPYLATEHYSGYSLQFSNNISNFERFVVKKITRNANFVCPVSKNLSKDMQKLGFEGNYKAIPNVVDTSLFYPSNKKNKIFTLIHISSLDDNLKNVSGILRVIKKIQDHIEKFQFILVGPNPEHYHNMIGSQGIHPGNIQLTGEISHKKVSEYLRKSDILLLFSRYESFSCVIKEAFASGVRVISSNVGGIKEYFPIHFGKLIEEGNESQLLHSILELHGNIDQVDKNIMYQYAKSHFSKDVICYSYTKLYFKMLKP